ncbi:MAG: hypothetical protein F6K41_05465 [Symploca sp. SIO3E6]|nr:hypothetical protein [Caldora sp. SIO3E6]
MHITQIRIVTIITTIAILGFGNLGLLVNRNCPRTYTKQSDQVRLNTYTLSAIRQKAPGQRAEGKKEGCKGEGNYK